MNGHGLGKLKGPGGLPGPICQFELFIGLIGSRRALLRGEEFQSFLHSLQAIQDFIQAGVFSRHFRCCFLHR